MHSNTKAKRFLKKQVWGQEVVSLIPCVYVRALYVWVGRRVSEQHPSLYIHGWSAPEQDFNTNCSLGASALLQTTHTSVCASKKSAKLLWLDLCSRLSSILLAISQMSTYTGLCIISCKFTFHYRKHTMICCTSKGNYSYLDIALLFCMSIY